MTTVPSWLIRFYLWRASQSAEIRWLATSVLLLAALVVRLMLGRLHGANPTLSFYPAIVLSALLFGWIEAIAALAVSIGLALYLFVPPDMYLLPVSWALVGGLNIALIALLQQLGQTLALANYRQQLQLQEMRIQVDSPIRPAMPATEGVES